MAFKQALLAQEKGDEAAFIYWKDLASLRGKDLLKKLNISILDESILVASKIRICNNQNCNVSTIGMKQCNGCKGVHYCGKECQRNDWTNHKASCGKIKK